jgi:hypothetical protein
VFEGDGVLTCINLETSDARVSEEPSSDSRRPGGGPPLWLSRVLAMI